MAIRKIEAVRLLYRAIAVLLIFVSHSLPLHGQQDQGLVIKTSSGGVITIDPATTNAIVAEINKDRRLTSEDYKQEVLARVIAQNKYPITVTELDRAIHDFIFARDDPYDKSSAFLYCQDYVNAEQAAAESLAKRRGKRDADSQSHVGDDTIQKDTSLVVEAAVSLGESLFYLGRFKESEAVLREALQLRPNDPALVSELGAALVMLSRADEAIAEFSHLLNIRTQLEGKGLGHPDIASVYNDMGLVLINKDDKDDLLKAEDLLTKAVRIRRDTLSKDHPLLADSLNNLGALYFKRREYRKAEALYREAKDIRERRLSLAPPNACGRWTLFEASVGGSWHNLGNVYLLEHNYTAAETAFLTARDIKTRALGKTHPYLAGTLNSLGALYRDQDRYDEALTFYQQAGTIWQGIQTRHPNLNDSVAMHNIAAVYYLQGNYADAHALIKQAISVRGATNKDNLDFADSINTLGEICLAEQMYQPAEILFKRALDIRTNKKITLGIADSLLNVGAVYIEENEFDKAMIVLNQAGQIVDEQIRKQEIEADNPFLVALHENLGELYLGERRYHEANGEFHHCLEILNHMPGSSRRLWAYVLYNLGKVNTAEVKFTEAEKNFREAIQIQEQLLGRIHPELSDTLTSYAQMLRQIRRDAEAVTIEERVRTDRVEHLQRNPKPSPESCSVGP